MDMHRDARLCGHFFDERGQGAVIVRTGDFDGDSIGKYLKYIANFRHGIISLLPPRRLRA
jgi:hypothetical protein